MSTIRLEVVSPDRQIFSDDINMLIVRSVGGELGILPRHAKLLTGLVPHAMRIKKDGGESLIAMGGGFMEVTPEKITVLANAAELPDAIDVERAQAAYRRAAERIEKFKQAPKNETDIDIERAEAALARAKARLKVKNISFE